MRSQCLALVALSVGLIIGGCGGGGDPKSTPAPAKTSQSTPVASRRKLKAAKQQIKETGDTWAAFFSAGNEAACDYMIKAAQGACDLGVYFDGRPSKFLQSFNGATVKQVKVRGDQAAAMFSNAQTVEFGKDKSDDDVPDSDWGVVNLGAGAGRSFFK
jgi:hypothetical protein